MGNICCGGEKEATKRSALSTASDIVDEGQTSSHSKGGEGGATSSHPSETGLSAQGGDSGTGLDASGTGGDGDQDALRAEAERHRALREEQARLELIVSAAGRDMVPVGRRDNAFDPAYAAAVHAELTQRGGAMSNENISNEVTNAMVHCPVRGKIPKSALPPGDFATVLDALSKSRWEGIELGKRGGEGGCGGEDPNYFFDDVAESFLDACVPTRAKLFQGTLPVVENLP
mmetsp:Transcript_33163/g.72721  ORF Transcript_33163/g.72721 Transcript_33163/m.72721 type:complete len:231 (-) Transcript_33163:87-779(-)